MISAIRVSSSDSEHIPLIRQMFADYQTELGIDLCFQGFAEELDTLPGPYAEPAGRLFLYTDDSGPAGVGALKPLKDGSVELKRIYLVPVARGKGYGRAISEHLLAEARSMSYGLAKLDTLARLTTAVALYRSLGFTETTAYNVNPEPDILYFELNLNG